MDSKFYPKFLPLNNYCTCSAPSQFIKPYVNHRYRDYDGSGMGGASISNVRYSI